MVCALRRTLLVLACQIVLFLPTHAFLLSPHTAALARAPAFSLNRAVCRHSHSFVSVKCSVSDEEHASTIFSLVKDTDRGADASKLPKAKREELYGAIEALEASNGQQELVKSDQLLGLYEVIWSGKLNASDEIDQRSSAAAGGYWRGSLGRALFRTEGLYQHVLKLPASDVPSYARIGYLEACAAAGIQPRADPEPIIAVNMVCARLLGVVHVTVVLLGIASPLDAPDLLGVAEIGRRRLPNATLPFPSQNTVRVDFAPPLIALGPPFLLKWLPALSIGPSTDVFLDSSFSKPSLRLRLGRGATSGSRFAFRRLPDPPPPSSSSSSSSSSSAAAALSEEEEEEVMRARRWELVTGGPLPAVPVKALGLLLLGLTVTHVLVAALSLLFNPSFLLLLPGWLASVLGIGAVQGGAAGGYGAGWCIKQIFSGVMGMMLWKAGGGIVRGEARRGAV